MGLDLRRGVLPQPDQGESCGGQLTHALSEESGVTADSSTSDICGADDPSLVQSIVWTDEKHNLYLDSLERSFIDQLNHSKRIQGIILHEGPFPSLQLDLGNCISSDEFKVLQDGCLQKIDFQSPKTRNPSAYNVTKRSWMHHFPDGNDYHLHSLAYLREGTSGIHASQNATFSCGIASTSMQHSSHHILYLNPVGTTAEGTDQNFADEDGKLRSDCFPKAKRVRISSADRQSNDQDETVQSAAGMLPLLREVDSSCPVTPTNLHPRN
ncbi:hypothetical protein SAY86_000373 [Trapa natans]|uniref:Uncharacterized protein n=1 Tax=Trapa natans TaxID=22666 RepID=A0AAN7MA44_TRANT|nr:hypothetical protein SAY86_000373 [Trapa natans]